LRSWRATVLLPLRKLPPVRGIYGATKDQMPKRALFLAPDAADSLLTLCAKAPGLGFSDIFRSAEASLAAMKTKRGVQPPAFSAHNFGLAVDVDVDGVLSEDGKTRLPGTLKRMGWKYPDLLAFMEEGGWYCHRRDGGRGSEDWHFNYLGSDPERAAACLEGLETSGWSKAAERSIVARFAAQLVLDPEQQQRALAKLRLYSGDFDGDLGPISREAQNAFCRTWDISLTDTVRYQRVLAYVSADVVES
jgi:hypothetical protein